MMLLNHQKQAYIIFIRKEFTAFPRTTSLLPIPACSQLYTQFLEPWSKFISQQVYKYSLFDHNLRTCNFINIKFYLRVKIITNLNILCIIQQLLPFPFQLNICLLYTASTLSHNNDSSLNHTFHLDIKCLCEFNVNNQRCLKKISSHNMTKTAFKSRITFNPYSGHLLWRFSHWKL